MTASALNISFVMIGLAFAAIAVFVFVCHEALRLKQDRRKELCIHAGSILCTSIVSLIVALISPVTSHSHETYAPFIAQFDAEALNAVEILNVGKTLTLSVPSGLS